MSQLSERVQRLVDGLSAVQRELNEQLITGAGDSACVLAIDNEDADALRNLKCVVDQLRHFLWFYLQAVTPGSENNERTMQLLRQVAKNTKSLAGTSPLTFLERLNALAEYALVHYQAEEGSRPN